MHIAVWHNLPSGGGKRALYDHIRGLLARGHTVESWCPPTADQTYLPLSDLITEHIVPLWQHRKPRTPLGKLSPSHWDVVRELHAIEDHCRRCAQEINAGGFDVLFANSSAKWAAAPIGRFVNMPKVLYLQEPSRLLYEAQPRPDAQPHLVWAAPSPGVTRWLHPRTARAGLKDMLTVRNARIQAREEARNAHSYDAMLVNSLFSRETMLRTYGVDARVCYLGVDTDLFVDLGLPRENVVVGVGSITPSKNIALVVHALAQLSAPRPRLLWIGNDVHPPYLAELMRLATANEIVFEPRVRISDSELVEILNRARLMVYTPRLEPFGFAPLEANAAGLPVVSVAEGGVRETVVDGFNGLLVEHDPHALAAGIHQLINHPEYAEQLGENGRRRAMEYWTLEASAARLEHHLSRVVHEGNRDALESPTEVFQNVYSAIHEH